VTLRRGSFNRSTPAAALNFLHYFANQGGDCLEVDAALKHFGHQSLPVDIHIVHFAEVQSGLALKHGGLCG
jgi:hypothetical protein